ncbi:MAG: endonuclease III [Planctomycetia bacterium]|jgi:endonuclease-3
MASLTEKKRHAAKLHRRLIKKYPSVKCSLDFGNPIQLLVATILSAQCTDKRVNIVTKDLFRRFRTAADFALVSQEELEEAIRSTGFFRNKAQNIRECCRELVENHKGKLPRDLETLVGLPGVGRKTANVVLGTAYGIASGVVVDTHVSRLSRRMGLTSEKNPTKIERELMAVLPREEWIDFSHRLVRLGREYCMARKPDCKACPVKDVCPKNL